MVAYSSKITDGYTTWYMNVTQYCALRIQYKSNSTIEKAEDIDELYDWLETLQEESDRLHDVVTKFLLNGKKS